MKEAVKKEILQNNLKVDFCYFIFFQESEKSLRKIVKENEDLNILRLEKDKKKETGMIEDMPFFDEETVEKYEEFKKFLNSLIIEKKSPKLITIITLKYLLNNYFNEGNSYIGEVLRQIPVEQISKIFSLKKSFTPQKPKQFNFIKTKKEEITENNSENLKKGFSSFCQKSQNTKMSGMSKDSEPGSFYFKVRSTVGMMLQLLLHRKKIDSDFEMENIFSESKNFEDFQSYKAKIIKTVIGFGYRIHCELSELKAADSALTLDEKTKKQIVITLKTFPYALRARIAGRLTRNMVNSLSGVGLCYEKVLQDRLNEKNLSILEVRSSIFSSDDFSLLGEEELFRGDFSILGNDEFRLNEEASLFA